MHIEAAIKIVREAGYRVTKLKPKKPKVTRVGPTCVCRFADGETCRMSTWAGNAEFDWQRGINNCTAAYQSRHKGKPVPEIVSVHFERDGEIVATQGDYNATAA